MVSINPLQRQPDTHDFAHGSQFRFNLIKIPSVEYFITQANVPGISFSGDANINTRFKSLAFMGDTLEFSDLELTFLVDENLQNYREIHDWMIGIAFPKSTKQFKDAVATSETVKPPTGSARVNPSVLQSDATLTILSNKNNPLLKTNFRGCYPTSLSGLQYNTQLTDTEQLTATVTLKYDLYEFEVL